MDRVFEAYNGGMGVEFMRKTRERMAWICSYVRGPRVLDVGCSQGVLPILLGRSGFVVQGLDINLEAIEYATNELKKELPSIRRSVTFSVGNFAQSDFSEQKYDTVIMGEVLEHLVRPDLFISKAFEALQDKGLLLITVPFGINDDPDHRQTFYLSKMMELLCPCFLIKEEKYLDGWIGFVAERRDVRAEAAPVADIHDLINVETAVFKRERKLLDRITDLQAKYKSLNEANLGLKSSVAKAESEIERLAKANAELTKDLANEKAWAAEHKKQFDQFLKETESKRKELEDKLAQERLLRRDYDRVVKQRDRLEKLYRKLSEAKLGRLTLAYWKFKDGIKNRKK